MLVMGDDVVVRCGGKKCQESLLEKSISHGKHVPSFEENMIVKFDC